jgi:hypothetical protein
MLLAEEEQHTREVDRLLEEMQQPWGTAEGTAGAKAQRGQPLLPGTVSLSAVSITQGQPQSGNINAHPESFQRKAPTHVTLQYIVTVQFLKISYCDQFINYTSSQGCMYGKREVYTVLVLAAFWESTGGLGMPFSPLVDKGDCCVQPGELPAGQHGGGT